MTLDEKIAGGSGATITAIACQACPLHAPWLYTAIGTSSSSGTALTAVYNKKHELSEFIHTNVRNLDMPMENPILYMDIIKNQELQSSYRQTEIATDISLALLAIPTTMIAYKGVKKILNRPKIKNALNNFNNKVSNKYIQTKDFLKDKYDSLTNKITYE